VGPEDLRIPSFLVGRIYPKSSLDLDHAMVLDLTKSHTYCLMYPTWDFIPWSGIWLPGYKAGWFRLERGNRAVAFVTDETHVLYIPTFDGFSLMLSTPDPQKLLDALRR
jgi:hypothetical protein